MNKEAAVHDVLNRILDFYLNSICPNRYGEASSQLKYVAFYMISILYTLSLVLWIKFLISISMYA